MVLTRVWGVRQRLVTLYFLVRSDPTLYISFMLGVETTLVDDDCARGDIAIYHVYTCWYNWFCGSKSLWWHPPGRLRTRPKFFFYIFPICWGSEPLWWVMTAGVEILLFMGYLHGINTCLRGPASIGHMVFFGPVRPLDIYFLYIWGRKWVRGSWLRGWRYRYIWGYCMVL